MQQIHESKFPLTEKSGTKVPCEQIVENVELMKNEFLLISNSQSNAG